MKSTLHRLLTIFLSLLLLLSMVACTSDKKEPATDTTVQETESEQPAESGIPAFLDGAYSVKLIYAAKASFYEKELRVNVSDLFKDTTGIAPPVLSDATPDGEPRYDGPAILIGETSYEESQSVYRELGENNACIRLVGNKLVLACRNEDTSIELLITLRELLSTHATKDKIVLTEDWNTAFDITFNADGNATFDSTDLIRSAPLPTDLMGREYDAGQGSSLYIRGNAVRATFNTVCEALAKNGMRLYTSNAIGNNLFITYVTQTQIAHVIYLPNVQEVRTAIDKRGEGANGFALTGLSGENTYQAVASPCMTLVEIENADWPGGLSMIFKLSDGRFFVIDSGIGGRKDNDGSSSGWIWASLAKHADDPNNIRVAAWLITHTHSDHAGGLIDMARGWYENAEGRHSVMPKNCTEIITIEKLIYNQPANMSKFGRGGWINEIIEAFDIKEVVKAHPGQELWFADLKLTVYTTQDLLVELDSSINDLNEYSVVTMIEFNGKRILSLGDADPRNNAISAKLYQNELKADVIQVSHHGYGDTGAKVVNELCNPDIVLWPVAKDEFSNTNCKFQKINEIFLKKENYAPHGGNITFDSQWNSTLIPNAELLEMIPTCDCGCGKKSSTAT